jgi:prepilin-type N-terminal cleavage/methylation domain-containing protein
MCQNTKKLRPRGPAFTLVELLVVVAILAISAAIVIPMASSANTMQLRAAVNIVAADLEYAKSMAISRGQMYSVVFDKNTEKYWIEGPDGAVIPHPVKKGFTYTMDFPNEGRLSLVKIDNVDFDGGDRVKFDYLGSPFNSAGTGLNSGVVTLKVGTVTRTVNVAAVTGYITVSN